MERAVTDLPEPDSPTIPSVVPFSRVSAEFRYQIIYLKERHRMVYWGSKLMELMLQSKKGCVRSKDIRNNRNKGHVSGLFLIK